MITRPQAPDGTWRYGVVKRKYRTILPKERWTESSYELVEVFSRGEAYSSGPVSFSASSVGSLRNTFRNALADLDKYDVIEDKDVVVHDMRKKVEKNDGR